MYTQHRIVLCNIRGHAMTQHDPAASARAISARATAAAVAACAAGATPELIAIITLFLFLSSFL